MKTATPKNPEMAACLNAAILSNPTLTDNQGIAPPCCAYLPNPESVRGRILGALLRGEALTQQDALRRFSNFRLAADIHVLKHHHGWEINKEWIVVLTKDAGRKSEVARYSMSSEAIADAGEEGQKFAALAYQAEIRRKAT